MCKITLQGGISVVFVTLAFIVAYIFQYITIPIIVMNAFKTIFIKINECIEGLKTILIWHIITCYNNNHTHKYNKQTNKQTKNHATRHDAKHYCKLYKNNTAYVLMPLTISTRASFPDHICKPTYTPFGCQKDTCHWRKSFRAFSQPPLHYKQWQDKLFR